MSSVFKSGISWAPSLIIFGCIALLIGLFFQDVLHGNVLEHWFFHAFDLVVIAFFVWILLRTNYEIDNQVVVCKSGPLSKKIEIAEIKSIDLSKKLWAGFRPALSLKGMVIYYNKFDEIFISPKDIEGFISVLKRINPGIKIING